MQGAASVAPEPQSQALNFDPNGPGMGLDINFNNFDLGDIDSVSDSINLNVGCRDSADIADFGIFNLDSLNVNNSMNFIANFSFEDTLKDAELSLGPHETFQESKSDKSSLSHLPSTKNPMRRSPKSPLPMHASSTWTPQHIRNLIPMRILTSCGLKNEKRQMRWTNVTSFQKVHAETKIRLHGHAVLTHWHSTW